MFGKTFLTFILLTCTTTNALALNQMLGGMAMQQAMTMAPNSTMSPGHGGHGMKMYFHHSAHATILFQQWHTMNWGQLAGSCVIVGVVATLYEGFKVLRELLMQRMRRKKSSFRVTPNTPSGKTMMVEEEEPRAIPSCRANMLSASHFLQTGLHFIQVIISYCLMLVFMTYNVWLCLAVALGSAVGYFLFAWMRSTSTDDNEHCN